MLVFKITLTVLLFTFSLWGACQVSSAEAQSEQQQGYFKSDQPNSIEIDIINLVLANIDNAPWLAQLNNAAYVELTDPSSENVCVFNQIKASQPAKQRLFSLPVNLQPDVKANIPINDILGLPKLEKPQMLASSPAFATRFIACDPAPQGQRIIADINQALRQLYKAPIFLQTHLKYIDPPQQPAFVQAFQRVFVIAPQQVLKFGVTHFPPYAFLPENNPPHGINIDAIEAIAKRLNMRVEYVHCPFARCIRMLETGMVDIYIGLTHSVARDQFMHFIEPFIARGSAQAFYVKNNSGVTINEFKDLNKLIIGVLRDSLYYEQFDNMQTFKKIETNSNPKLIELLRRERIDTFIGGRDMFAYLLEELGLSEIIIRQSYEYVDNRKVYITLSKRSIHQELVPALSEAVDYVKRKGMLIPPYDEKRSP